MDYSKELIYFVENIIFNLNDKNFNKKFDSFETLLDFFSDILEEENIIFKYQKSNSIKKGSANIKINKNTLEITKILYLDKKENEFFKMNIFFHELAHFILDHNNLKEKIIKIASKDSKSFKITDRNGTFKLNKMHKEFIADSLSEIFVFIFSGKKPKEYIFENKDLFLEYRFLFLKKTKLNKNQLKVSKEQINFFIYYLFNKKNIFNIN